MCRQLIYMILCILLSSMMTGQAQEFEWIRAAYWDGRYPTAWAGSGEGMRDSLQKAGYTILDANQLKTWMNARISDKKSSVVVFCRDIVPDTVCETASSGCTLRRYLNAGGKIVWYADIPMYYQGHSDGSRETWDIKGSTAVLGLNAAGAEWDSYTLATPSTNGIDWGLERTWLSVRAASPDGLTVLAEDGKSNASAWVKHFVAGDQFRGFVRIWDRTGTPSVQEVVRVAEYVVPLTAHAPEPADGSRGADPTRGLSWLPGRGAVQYRLYLGDSSEAVMPGAKEVHIGPGNETTFRPGLLRAGTTYYWRVVETTPDGSLIPGEIWSFTTEPGVAKKIVHQWWMDIPGTNVSDLRGNPDYPDNPTGSELLDVFESLVDWADNYGTRMYGWLKPPVSGEYRFWIAGDDEQQLWLSTDEDPANAVLVARVREWTAFREWGKYLEPADGLPPQLSSPIELEAGKKYYIEAQGKEGGGGDSTAVAWQPPGSELVAIPGQYVDTFAYPPLRAFSPRPADGAVLDAIRSPQLEWAAGERAFWHDVYFGNDEASVANATPANTTVYRDRQPWDDLSWPLPIGLGWDETYYWRIDEVEKGGLIRRGDVWSFTTADFILIDDFEIYNNDLPTKMVISQTWLDGLTNNTGSYVGYLEAPFVEQKIVHGGRQSMPFFYRKTREAAYSETECAFDPPQNWTVGGVNTLSLWFRGDPANSPTPLYVAVEGEDTDDYGVVYHPDPNAVLAPNWTKWRISLNRFSASGLDLKVVKKMYIGVGDRHHRSDFTAMKAFATVASGDEPNDANGVLLVDTITLEGYDKLKGTVRDMRTGQPVANVMFSVTWPDTNETTLHGPFNGSYEIRLGPGTYKIAATADGYSETALGFETYGGITRRDILLMVESPLQLSRPIYRFISAARSWYFTADASERNQLLYDETEVKDSCNWTYNGIAFCALDPDGQPNAADVYRVWCDQGTYTTHLSYPFYTTSEKEKDDLLKSADSYMYGDEGIAFTAYPSDPNLSKCKGVHRFKSVGRHFYTISDEERERWEKHADWEDLGIAWYAFDYVNVDDLNAPASP